MAHPDDNYRRVDCGPCDAIVHKHFGEDLECLHLGDDRYKFKGSNATEIYVNAEDDKHARRRIAKIISDATEGKIN